MFTSIRRTHHLFAASLFGLLGFHVGVWAVQLAPPSVGLGLHPAALGAALTVAAVGGLVTLFAGGTLADRVGRRPVLVIGFAGTGTAFVAMALAGSFATLIPAVLLYGLSVSFIDLGANTVGSAYEQSYQVTAMTGLHAWFSGGALAGAIGSAAALRAGVSYRGVYLGLSVVMAAGLVTALLAAVPAPPGGSTGGSEGRSPGRGRRVRPARVWRIPAVLFAIALISVTFFGDGALETIAPVVPTTLSLAGRSAPGRSGQAVATTTAAGYGSFILSPLTIGLIAQATSLRLALGLLVLTSLAIAGLATRWPGSAPR